MCSDKTDQNDCIQEESDHGGGDEAEGAMEEGHPTRKAEELMAEDGDIHRDQEAEGVGDDRGGPEMQHR